MSHAINPVFQALYARRSIRRFAESRPVEREKIVLLLEAAMAAPSACNIQPWDFVVVREPRAIAGIKATIKQYGDYNVDTVIAVCGRNDHIPWKDFGLVDCAMAMQNLMVAAPSLGLGTVCIGGFDRTAIRPVLGLPEGVAAVGLVYLGYPAEEKAPRTKYLAEAVHWERYDAARPQPPRPGNVLVDGLEASV